MGSSVRRRTQKNGAEEKQNVYEEEKGNKISDCGDTSKGTVACCAEWAQQDSWDEAGMQAGVSGAFSWLVGSVGKAPTSPVRVFFWHRWGLRSV